MRDSQNKRGGRLIYLIPAIIIAICLYVTARPKLNNSFEFRDRQTIANININRDSSSVVEFKPFDPNTADYRTMLASGVPRTIAVNLLKWRESGKVFRIKEDVALCYGMTDSLYFMLEPYITIGEETN